VYLVAKGRIPDARKCSVLLPVSKGKVDPMECEIYSAVSE